MLRVGKKITVWTGIAGFIIMAGAAGASDNNAALEFVVRTAIAGLALMVGSGLFYMYLDQIEWVRSQKRGKNYRQMLIKKNKKSA